MTTEAVGQALAKVNFCEAETCNVSTTYICELQMRSGVEDGNILYSECLLFTVDSADLFRQDQ